MTVPDIKPMKMTDLPLDLAQKYLDDPNWVLEQKMDGARALVTAVYATEHRDETGKRDPRWEFDWRASGGGPLKFAAAVQHIQAIETELAQLLDDNEIVAAVLDGELIVEEGEYRVFDVAYLKTYDGNELVTIADDYEIRSSERDALFGWDGWRHIQPVFTAVGTEKEELWKRINAEGVEGGMLKDLRAPYEPGVRTKSQLKLKLVKTADVIVTSVERKFDHKGMVTHGSAGLALRIRPDQDPKPYVSGVTEKRISADEYSRLKQGTKAQLARALAHEYSPRQRISVGAASLIGKDLTIDVGDVVEVAYLYWGGDALVQPRILRKRLPEEKLPDDCHMGQVPAYSRKAV